MMVTGQINIVVCKLSVYQAPAPSSLYSCLSNIGIGRNKSLWRKIPQNQK